MGKLNKIAALLTSICISTNAFITSYAYVEKSEIATMGEYSVVVNAKTYNTKSDSESLKSILEVDLSEFEAYIVEQIVACNETIDISEYKIESNEENQKALANYIYGEIEEAFHFSSMSIYGNGIYYTKLKPLYNYSAEEYKEMLGECEAIADSMVSDIVDNENLTDAEKALLLHDRIADNCLYDYIAASEGNPKDMAFAMYGALVEGEAVCQGYAEAYNYLLEKVGIESYLCTSNSMVHAWNIVYIDGKPYHVDITWDDTHLEGGVCHNNFLLSSNALYNGVNGANGHTGTDYDTSPADTKYDSYYWQNSETVFQLIDGEIYYFDNNSSNLIREKDGQVLTTVNDMWLYNSIQYWRGNYTRLSSDGMYLYYNDAEKVYKYDLESNKTSVVFSPDLSVGDTFSVFGFTYKNGYLVCDLNNTPNYDNNQLPLQEKLLYDEIKPVIENAAVTNNLASQQNVELCFNDNSGILGYYFGTSIDYNENAFYEDNSENIALTISNEGTYYVNVVDLAGNVSKTYNVTFYNTSLETDGGEIDCNSILTAENYSFVLPAPVKTGYEFVGWAMSKTDDVADVEYYAGDEFSPTENSSLYSIYNKLVVPTVEPTVEPTAEPTAEPTIAPTAEPTVEPTAEPTIAPTAEPTAEPTIEPTVEPTIAPTVEPTTEPTIEPTAEPTVEPTAEPTIEPTAEPTIAPTVEPTAEPTVEPTAEPTIAPTVEPTVEPTIEPTIEPTVEPTIEPTAEPTIEPTAEPTIAPTVEPTAEPTVEPTVEPTIVPTVEPTVEPTAPPTESPEMGDADGNGVIEARDATYIRRCAASGWEVDLPLSVADLNKDGIIDAKDVTIIRRKIAKGWS